jgi:hypothetical protein
MKQVANSERQILIKVHRFGNEDTWEGGGGGPGSVGSEVLTLLIMKTFIFW